MNRNICSNSALLHLKKRQKWCYEKFLIQVQVSFSGLILKISLLNSDNSGYFHKFCCTFNLLLFQYVHLDSMLETWKNANDFLTVTNFIIIWITEKLKKPKGSIRWDIFICPHVSKVYTTYFESTGKFTKQSRRCSFRENKYSTTVTKKFSIVKIFEKYLLGSSHLVNFATTAFNIGIHKLPEG